MKSPNKVVILIVFILLLFSCLIPSSFAEEESYPADISGKILDKDSKLFVESVTIVIKANIRKDAADIDYTGDEYKVIEYRQTVSGGVFSWKGKSYVTDVLAEKDGYHSSSVEINSPWRDNEIKQNDILIYMIPKGTPSKLEYVEGAHIPDKTDPKSGGKDCGWSFNKLWYFPVAEEETAWMTRSINENGNAVYTMKEPGGFIWYPGYPQFESKPDELSASFEWMAEAPETGYVQTFTPIDHYYRPNDEQDIYCYFRTPDGKYGKMTFTWQGFSYYIQPDGSRNLEAGEVVKTGPLRPEYKKLKDREQGIY